MKIKINNEISQNVQDIELGSISLANIIDLIRPIGSLYWSENNTNPSTIYPGTTWVQITDKFIVAAGSTYQAGSSYGAASHTHTSAAHTHTVNGHTHSTGNHTLTVAEMPSHMHEVMQRRNSPTPVSSYYNTNYTSGSAEYFMQQSAKSTNTGSTDNLFTSYTGSSGAHNHGNTGSTSLTTNSTTPGNTGSSSNIPPSIAMYCWKRTA